MPHDFFSSCWSKGALAEEVPAPQGESEFLICDALNSA